jgi:hypothetical protein
MYRRRPDLGPVPVPEFRSFEPATPTVAVRATGPVAEVGFSHLEVADAVPVKPGVLPVVQFIAPPDRGQVGGADVHEEFDPTAGQRRTGGRQRRRRRGRS